MIAELLHQEHSKAQTEKVAHYIGNNEQLFKELLMLIADGGSIEHQRGSWVLRSVCEKHPDLLYQNQEAVFEILKKKKHDAVCRNILALFSDQKIILKSHQTEAINFCFEILADVKSPVAVKVHAMSWCFELCKGYPELLHELRLYLDGFEGLESAGLRSRSNKVKAKINQLLR